MVGLINNSEEKVLKSQQELVEEFIETEIPVTGHKDIETLEMYLSASDYDDDDFDDEDDFNDDDDFEDEDDSSEIEPDDEIYDDDFDFDEDDDEDLFDDDDDLQYN